MSLLGSGLPRSRSGPRSMPTGVCEKQAPPERGLGDDETRILASKTLNQNLESSLCCWIAGERLLFKERVFSDTGKTQNNMGPHKPTPTTPVS